MTMGHKHNFVEVSFKIPFEGRVWACCSKECQEITLVDPRLVDDREGVWVVYQIGDWSKVPMPLYLTLTEADARLYVSSLERINQVGHIKFWRLGDEFGTE